MPVIDVDFQDLRGLLGKAGREISMERFLERVPMIGADVEEVEGDLARIEFFPDRPDLYSVEGVARAMAAFLDLRTGLRHYDVRKSRIGLRIDRSVTGVRPHMIGAVIRDIAFDDRFIRSLMDVQEKLHGSLGRNRKRVSIGLHDLDRVDPPFTYKGVDPESVTFVPLGEQRAMDMREVLRHHDKGREYGWIVEDHPRWPLLVDANDEVLSFPPIINGELTTVQEGTENVLIDVTGLDRQGVDHALKILCAMFADRGGNLESITVERPGGEEGMVSPDMRPRTMRLKAGYVNGWLGTDMDPEDMASALERMGHKARTRGRDLEVTSPPYRMDILHPVDLVEDVAIGHGYENFSPTMPRIRTTGTPAPVQETSGLYRVSLVGLGYLEVDSLILSNEEDEFAGLGIEGVPEGTSVVDNPASERYSILRPRLLPSLLRTLAANRHLDLPQRIFEVGDVIRDHRRQRRVAALSIHERASFTESKSVVQAVLRDLGRQHRFQASEAPGFMEGRCAAIIVDNEPVGHFGEISPRTITAFELEYPVAGFELGI